jgi:hypothetical protein
MRKTRKCKFCHAPFHPKRSGRRQLYCKPSHAQRAYERRQRHRLKDRNEPVRALVMDIRQMLLRKEIETVVRKVLSAILPDMLQVLLQPKEEQEKKKPPHLRLVKPKGDAEREPRSEN